MSSDTVLVRRPTATPAGEVSAPSFVLNGPISGVRVGIRTDSAWRSWRLIAGVWDEYLRRDGATTNLVETGGMVGLTGANDRKHIEELEQACEKFEVSKQRYLERESQRTEKITARKILATKGTLKMSGR